MEQLLLYWSGNRHPKSTQYAHAVIVRTTEQNSRYESEFTANGFFFSFLLLFFEILPRLARLCGKSADTFDIVSILDVLNAVRETDNGKVRVTRFDRFMKDVILFLSRI